MGQVTVLHRSAPGAPVTKALLNADPFKVLEWIFRRGGIQQGVYDPKFDRRECARLERERQLKGTA